MFSAVDVSDDGKQEDKILWDSGSRSLYYSTRVFRYIVKGLIWGNWLINVEEMLDADEHEEEEQKEVACST